MKYYREKLKVFSFTTYNNSYNSTTVLNSWTKDLKEKSIKHKMESNKEKKKMHSKSI